MNVKKLWFAWLYCFILCAVLGFFPEPSGFFKFMFVVVAVGFFVPPFLLLKHGQKKTHRLVLTASAVSLTVTVVLIILNFTSVLMPKLWGSIFYWMLVVFSTPMICGQYWVLSLFGWAFLMFSAISVVRTKEKTGG